MAKKAMPTAEHMAEAKRLGALAHDTGKLRFPGGDAALMAMCKLYPFPGHEQAGLMQAWLNAWDGRRIAQWVG